MYWIANGHEYSEQVPIDTVLVSITHMALLHKEVRSIDVHKNVFNRVTRSVR